MPSVRQLIDAVLSPRKLPGDLFARVEAAAHDAATSPYSRDQPTPDQLEANRYRTGRVDIQGLPIRIENPRGTRREKPGKWSNLMTCHYGDIAGTRGADGDPVDVFIGPFPELATVWVVNQRRADGGFDEHKVCIGFAGEQQARDAYLSAYSRGWKGLESIVPATVTQLKWWLKFGDTSRPFTPEVLPYEGTPIMDKVLWNSQAQPVTQQLPAIMYALRVEDAEAGLMLDAANMADMMADPDVQAMPMLDAMVVEVGRLQPKMEALRRIMEAASDTVKPTEMNIGDPVRYRGVAQVMVLFTMSDGQTVSVWLHNPDTTPAKLMPLDELISWKWMLNKKDVTIVVAPEKGRDLNPREVARRIMRLVERNSAAFTKANARTAEKAEQLKALDAEIGALETELADLQGRIEVAKVGADERAVEKGRQDRWEAEKAKILSEEGYSAVWAGGGDAELRKKWQDVLDSHFQGRIVEVRNALRDLGWAGENFGELSKGGATLKMQFEKAGAGGNVVGVIYSVVGSIKEGEGDPIRDTLGATPQELAAKLDAKVAVQEPAASSFDDYLAAVIVALAEKADISAVDAKKMADNTNLVSDGHADGTPAEQVADKIIAANTRSPNVERAYAIAQRLIAFYGWTKSLDNDMPEMGINLESPRDNERWVYLGEEGGKLIADSHNKLKFAFDPELSRDSELAQNIDLADFEAELDTGVDGLLGESEEFAGKTVAFAFAAEVLRKGAVAAGAMVQFGDFNGSSTNSMFDKVSNPTPYADVSVYGITAQIGLDGKVLGRASIDEAGKIEILKGSGGSDVYATPQDAADVRMAVQNLMAEEAAKPAVVPEPEPEPVQPGETTAVMGVSEGEDIPDAEDPIAVVDAAYKFDDATDEFKRWVADSVNETDYSTFLSAKNIDIAAKKHGARVAWAVAMVTDSVEGEGDSDGAILDNAGAKKIVVDDQVPVKDRPFGAKQVAFVTWGTSGGAFLVDLDKEDRMKFGGGTFMAPAGELPGSGPRLVRIDPKAMTMEIAQKSLDNPEWTDPVKLKGIKVQNLGKFTGAFRVAAALDSVDAGDVILDAAEGWETVVGTIKKGSKIVGRAHVGGDGKAMVYVGKKGNTRVQFLSKADGQLRDGMWSENPEYMVDALFTEPVNGVAKAGNEPAGDGKPGREAIIPAVKYLADFVSAQQLDTMTSAVRGEEGQWFIDKFLSLMDQIKGMPGVRGQDGKGNRAIAYLHYFKGGADWYITERDMDGEQLQAFGLADLGQGFPEVGYINIQELIENNVELDLHWTPKTLAEIQGKAPDAEDGDESQPAAEANPDREFLQSMVDGTVNLLDPAIAERLVPMVEQYADDADMTALIERAAQAYGDAAVAAARQALATA